MNLDETIIAMGLSTIGFGLIMLLLLKRESRKFYRKYGHDRDK